MTNATPDTLSTPAAPARSGTAYLDLGGFSGLTEDSARRQVEQDGPNELPTQKKRGLRTIAFEVVREPMFLMLVAAGILYFLSLGAGVMCIVWFDLLKLTKWWVRFGHGVR